MRFVQLFGVYGGVILMIFLHQISDNYHYFVAEIPLKISLIFGRNIIIFPKKIMVEKKVKNIDIINNNIEILILMRSHYQ